MRPPRSLRPLRSPGRLPVPRLRRRNGASSTNSCGEPSAARARWKRRQSRLRAPWPPAWADRSCVACWAACSAAGSAEAMSRWRPPPERSTAIITRAGYERLREEFNDLWKVRRPEVVKALSEAAAEGDRSENAEYIYRKKQLGEIDRRVRYLTKRLQELRVVDDPPTDPSAVYFGAWMRLESEDGQIHDYRIVGPDETDAARGWISIDSPIA